MQDLLGKFQKLIEDNRLTHAYVIDGGDQKSRMDFVVDLAAHTFSFETKRDVAESKQQILGRENINFNVIEPEGRFIRIDTIRLLVEEMSRSSFGSLHRFYVLNQADRMTPEAANSLLKFLEEPTPGIHLILLVDTKESLLSTIQSRCQWIHLTNRPKEELWEDFQEAGISRQRSNWLVFQTTHIDEALEMAEDTAYFEQLDVKWRWFELLCVQPTEAFLGVSKLVLEVATSRELALSYIDDLLFFTRDLLLIKNGSYEAFLSRVDQKRKYVEIAKRRDNTAWFVIEEVLKVAQHQIESNVSIQSVFEAIVLKVQKEWKV